MDAIESRLRQVIQPTKIESAATTDDALGFRLTPLGQSLLSPMASLIDWADRRYSDIHDARARFDGASRDVPRSFVLGSAERSAADAA